MSATLEQPQQRLKDYAMNKAERQAYNKGIEDAANVAAPAYHKEKPGSWARLRIRLADEIRACKVEIGNA